jgi:hypothetical protein
MMGSPMDESSYYTDRMADLLQGFDEDARRCRAVLTSQCGAELATAVLQDGRARFEAQIPQIPYIGSDESLTVSLVESVSCLAFYQALVAHGRTAADAGRVLFEAVLARAAEPRAPIPPSQTLTPEQLMERRKRRADRSQRREYPQGFVCTFIPGGPEFDYGYDFTECATLKFYHARGADEFLPFYCYLDFAVSKVLGLGLTRTMCLAEGDAYCNHRFKAGRATDVSWPPPFLSGRNAGSEDGMPPTGGASSEGL